MMSDTDLQREQTRDVVCSSSCFVLMVWHDDVLGVCVSTFVEICSLKCFRSGLFYKGVQSQNSCQ